MRSSFAVRSLFTAFLLVSCEDEAAGPQLGSGTIVVTASTGGEGRDTDGFRLTIDGSDALLLQANSRIFLTGLSEGTHQLQLLGIAANCSVQGTNPRSVSVGAGERSETTFTITCVPELSGGFSISVTTTGSELDQDGYGLSVAGTELRHININAVELFTGLAPGVHLVTLKDLAEGCSLMGGNPQPFTVVKDKVVQVKLQVICG